MATMELKADPRTGLEIIEIPADYENYFRDLKGSLIHWFGAVQKYNHMYKTQNRICIISDQCIYLCRTDGSITRCVHIQAIQEVLVTDQTAIGFRVSAPDFDMLLAVETENDRENIIRVVSKVYWNLVGTEITVRTLSGDSGEAVSQQLQLDKPKGWQPTVIPMKTTKALAKILVEKREKELADRRIVEEEFDRIKRGLRQQLEQHRTEEYDRMVDNLSNYVKALEEKDLEIQRLKENSLSMDDPEVWKKCPNCTQLRRVLESHSNDDKQKILRLEREIESQRHIVEHLQAAIQHRTGNTTRKVMEGGTEASASQVVVLKQELAESTRKNKELQQIIMESPYITADTKQKAAKMAAGLGGGGGGGSLGSSAVSGASVEVREALAEKDREIRHLKSVLRDATFRQVQELESIRSQFQQYDNQIVSYLEKVFSGQIQARPGGTPQQMAQATAEAARHAATPDAFGSGGGGGYNAAAGPSAITQSPFKQFTPPVDTPYSNSSPAGGSYGGGGGGTPSGRINPLQVTGGGGMMPSASPGGGGYGGMNTSFSPPSQPAYQSQMGGLSGPGGNFRM